MRSRHSAQQHNPAKQHHSIPNSQFGLTTILDKKLQNQDPFNRVIYIRATFRDQSTSHIQYRFCNATLYDNRFAIINTHALVLDYSNFHHNYRLVNIQYLQQSEPKNVWRQINLPEQYHPRRKQHIESSIDRFKQMINNLKKYRRIAQILFFVSYINQGNWCVLELKQPISGNIIAPLQFYKLEQKDYKNVSIVSYQQTVEQYSQKNQTFRKRVVRKVWKQPEIFESHQNNPFVYCNNINQTLVSHIPNKQSQGGSPILVRLQLSKFAVVGIHCGRVNDLTCGILLKSMQQAIKAQIRQIIDSRPIEQSEEQIQQQEIYTRLDYIHRDNTRVEEEQNRIIAEPSYIHEEQNQLGTQLKQQTKPKSQNNSKSRKRMPQDLMQPQNTPQKRYQFKINRQRKTQNIYLMRKNREE